MNVLTDPTPPNAAQRREGRDHWAAHQGLVHSSANAHMSIAPLVDPHLNKCALPAWERRSIATHRRYMDHGTAWKKPDGSVVVIGQPYGLTDDDVKQLAADCETYGLVSSVSAYPSWHYPGSVLTVRLERP